MTRIICNIAEEITMDLCDTRQRIPHAMPHLQAMFSLYYIKDMYGCDSGKDIIRRFLCNAQSWKGETARRIKKELNTMLT